MKDQLPAGLTFVSATGTDWNCSVDGSKLVTCDKASGTGDGRNVSLGNIRIDASVTGSGQATNTASIAPTSALPDGNPDNDTASDRGPIIQNPQFDIKALKTGPTNMLPGAIGTFEISTRNNNSGTLSTVSYFGTISMTDTLPAGFTFVRYGERWKIFNLSSPIGGTPATGAATPIK